ncbi:hypothetical protein, partial [uncultured Hoeflea sp.]|uniref:hypothetical protein n=1 Tax=uncultured Hoeflea sp. TaxID=538666 RepID=UPI0030DA21EF
SRRPLQSTAKAEFFNGIGSRQTFDQMLFNVAIAAKLRPRSDSNTSPGPEYSSSRWPYIGEQLTEHKDKTKAGKNLGQR